MSWSRRVLAVRGPSLPARTLPASVEDLPPAGAGDLAALRGIDPCTVVLIDGLFEARPAPWHKELLDLQARGFRVIGAASMGALRAAELAAHGMIGVGAVFRAYASGRITADDEVAVLHAPAELDWRPVTEALVDVRATLCAAVRAGIVDKRQARAIRATAAAINFRDRTWPAILAAEPRAQALSGWLPDGRVSIKQGDALAAITLAIRLRDVPPLPTPAPPLTSMLRALVQHADMHADYANEAVSRSRKNALSVSRRNG